VTAFTAAVLAGLFMLHAGGPALLASFPAVEVFRRGKVVEAKLGAVEGSHLLSSLVTVRTFASKITRQTNRKPLMKYSMTLVPQGLRRTATQARATARRTFMPLRRWNE
jgi:hypothetical protein